MNVILIFAWVCVAMIAMSFWESYAEQRNAWDKGKAGWKIRFGKFKFTGYHFYLWYVMMPLLISLPLVVYGFDLKLFGILVSAYFIGNVIEDFMWYVVNPKVKFKEFYGKFSDYYPWIRIGSKKIIPLGYLTGILISVASWYFLWR
jgi:hypothetical protein